MNEEPNTFLRDESAEELRVFLIDSDRSEGGNFYDSTRWILDTL